MTLGVATNQGGSSSPRGGWAATGRPLAVVRWLRTPLGDWCHEYVAGQLVAKTGAGGRLLVDGAEAEYRVKEGWHVCTA